MLIATWTRKNHRERSSEVKRFLSQEYFSHYRYYRTSFPKVIGAFLLALKENSIVEFDFRINLMATMWE